MMRTLWLALLLTVVSGVQAPQTAATEGDVSSLSERQQQLTMALEKVRGCVVGVTDGFGYGSGVVVSEDGIVLTASHVVGGDRRRGRRSERLLVTFPDGSQYPFEILGMNRNVDAAMIRITRPAKDNNGRFPFVEMAQSSDLSAGDYCFALGHPGGYRPDRTAPVRFGRLLSVGDRTIVSDCAIVLGDSGGPLFNLNGDLIGIHSMITDLIFENRHVAIDNWHREWDRFLANDRWGKLRARSDEQVESLFFGVGLRWRDFVPEVTRVVADSPADRAGLEPGDVLVRVNGQRFADRLDLEALLADLSSDETIPVQIRRDGQLPLMQLVTGVREDPDDDEQLREREENERRREYMRQMRPNRRIGPYEKRTRDELEIFRESVGQFSGSVVSLRESGLPLCYGTVVSRDGYILTKASEMDRADSISAHFASGDRREAEIINVNRSYDLMLLKVDPPEGLEPVRWAQGPSAAGELIAATDSRGTLNLPGVVSVAARQLEGSERGFLGVTMGPAEGGVLIREVLPSGSAARGGLKENDVVLSIDGKDIGRPDQMLRAISTRKPGDIIAVRIRREDAVQTFRFELTSRFRGQDAMLPRYQSLDQAGVFTSVHNGGYPMALQHDCDTFPRQCGGPLFNIRGEAVGINIARAGRVISYAIPADVAEQKVRELMSAEIVNPL